jgi:hypothetical protein
MSGMKQAMFVFCLDSSNWRERTQRKEILGALEPAALCRVKTHTAPGFCGPFSLPPRAWTSGSLAFGTCGESDKPMENVHIEKALR